MSAKDSESRRVVSKISQSFSPVDVIHPRFVFPFFFSWFIICWVQISAQSKRERVSFRTKMFCRHRGANGKEMFAKTKVFFINTGRKIAVRLAMDTKKT